MDDEQSDLRRIVDHASAGLIEIDGSSAVRSANAAAARLLGFTTIRSLLNAPGGVGACFEAPEDHVRLLKRAEAGEPAEAPLRRLTGNGEKAVWLSVSYRRVETMSGPCYAGSLADVSALVERARACADAERHYRELFSSAPVGIYRVAPDGRVISANPAFADMFGQDAGDALADGFRPFASYVEPARRSEFVRQVEMYGFVKGFESQIACPDPDRPRIWVSETARVVRNADGETLYYEGVMEDITARKETEALRRVARRAEQANRTKSEFLAAMSHELRTPLNGVIGAAHVLRRSVEDTRERQLADLIVNSGESLLAILNDILDLAKVEAGRLELEIDTFEPRQLVEDAVGHWRPLTQEKNVELEIDVSGSVPDAVLGDARRIRQVLWNYLSNALKFTEEGAITLAVDARPDGACSRIRFEVRDSGKGVPVDQRERVFDKFYQLEGASRGKGGTGLGLAICQQFAALMGGEVGCDEAPGGGACFWFSAPFQEGGAAQPEDEAAGQDGSGLCGVKILAAEDNAINRAVLNALLEGYQCDLTFAENGRQALEMIARNAYDIVLMDIQMPEMDGIEAVRRLRASEIQARARRIPVVALTANAMDGDRETYLEAGMDGFVAKPIDPQLLVDTILGMLNRTAAPTLDRRSNAA